MELGVNKLIPTNIRPKVAESKKMKIANVNVIQNAEILETKEYNVFSFDIHNRPINEAKVNGFIKKFKDGHNFMTEFPAIVSENFVLLDGQHRFMACKYLGIPFVFRFSNQLTIDNVVEIQSNAGWTNRDYLHAFVSQKKQDYIIVQRFLNKYQVPLSVAVSLLAGAKWREGMGKIGFYNGTFKVKAEDFAHKVCDMALKIKSYGWKNPYDRNFLIALARVMSHEKYDEKRLLDKARQFGASLLHKQVSVESAVINFEELYNYHALEKAKVRFM